MVIHLPSLYEEEIIEKTVFTRQEWETTLDDIETRKADMNKLVMNYMVIEGYVKAAEKFWVESGTELYMDLATTAKRMAVKKAAQIGNVEDAIKKVDDLNPEILDTNPHLFFHLQQQRCIELIRNKKVKEALDYAQEELARKGAKNPGLLEELERTVSLLAFEDVKSSPFAELLGLPHRLETASELNAAILTSQSQEKDPKLTIILKTLIWGQNELDLNAFYPRIYDLSNATLEDPGVFEN